jgi:type II secretory pathway component PulF
VIRINFRFIVIIGVLAGLVLALIFINIPVTIKGITTDPEPIPLGLFILYFFLFTWGWGAIFLLVITGGVLIFFSFRWASRKGNKRNKNNPDELREGQSSP